MQTRFIRTDEATQTGGGTTGNLFSQLFDDNKKALAGQNKNFLEQDLKMRFISSVNNANGQINSLLQQLNNERAKLGSLNLNNIISLKNDIADYKAQITGAQEEYTVLFGTTMPETII